MDVYLLKVDAGANNNKFYLMHQEPNSQFFTVRYGRVGNEGVTQRYPKRLWNIKYAEKISKGYIDQSSLRGRSDDNQATFIGACADIMEELMRYANQTIKKNYTIEAGSVTPQMIEAARDTLRGLANAQSINEFNSLLMEAFNILPRKMNIVSNYLAKQDEDFARILKREQDLLDVMEGFVDNSAQTERSDTTDLFKQLGLKMSVASREEIDNIINLVDPRCEGKVARVWRVTNEATQKNYDKFIKDHGIKSNKLLWHGSGNENWFSILKLGLKIRPSGAKYTGSMFGDGIYFATKASKSFGYTSYRGSYWRCGSDTKAFMALFEVATGNQYDVYDYGDNVGSMTYDRLRKLGDYNCLFAHAGSMLYNDEIVLYRPDQVTVKYLVEFK